MAQPSVSATPNEQKEDAMKSQHNIQEREPNHLRRFRPLTAAAPPPQLTLSVTDRSVGHYCLDVECPSSMADFLREKERELLCRPTPRQQPEIARVEEDGTVLLENYPEHRRAVSDFSGRLVQNTKHYTRTLLFVPVPTQTTHTPDHLTSIGSRLFVDTHDRVAMCLVNQTQAAMLAVADKLHTDLHSMMCEGAFGQSNDRVAVRMCRDLVKQLKVDVQTANYKLRQSLLLLVNKARRKSLHRGVVNNRIRDSLSALSGVLDDVDEEEDADDEDCDSTQSGSDVDTDEQDAMKSDDADETSTSPSDDDEDELPELQQVDSNSGSSYQGLLAPRARQTADTDDEQSDSGSDSGSDVASSLNSESGYESQKDEHRNSRGKC